MMFQDFLKESQAGIRSNFNSRGDLFEFVRISSLYFLVVLWFDLENFGLERSGALKGRFPPIFVKNAPEDSGL